LGAPPVAPLQFVKRASYDRADALALRRLVMFLAEESATSQRNRAESYFAANGGGA
jgi:hypothetical protein